MTMIFFALRPCSGLIATFTNPFCGANPFSSRVLLVSSIFLPFRFYAGLFALRTYLVMADSKKLLVFESTSFSLL